MTPQTGPDRPTRPAGAGGFWLVAAMGTALSANTSWLFFGDIFHIADWRERAAMFAVLEVMFLALGWATRANVRRNGKPGAARNWAWALCGAAAYMAITVSGPVAGIARVLLGPLMALVALHLALGIEIRAKHGSDTGAWAKIRNEVRERLLSRMGLGDDQRTALARTRDRARDRAARLATADGWVPQRQVRLARAVRACGATLDKDQRARLVEQIAVLRHVGDLATADLASPWATHGVRTRPRTEPRTEARGRAVGEPLTAHLTDPSTDPAPDPSAHPSPHTSLNPAVRPNATAIKVARLRGRHPDATQAVIAKKAGVSVATVARYWQAIPPAAQPSKTNGHEVLELAAEVTA